MTRVEVEVELEHPADLAVELDLAALEATDLEVVDVATSEEGATGV